MKSFAVRGQLPLTAQNAGLFISRGVGMHPERVINSCELIFVRRGKLGMFEGARRFEVGAGQTLLLRPGCRHGGTTQYPPDLSFYWVHFTMAPVRGASGRNSLLAVPATATLRRPERMIELFRRFLDDQESGALTKLSGACLILQMLSEVSRSAGNLFHESPASTALASRAEGFIRTHFAKKVSASDIARVLKCNPDYLGRVFHLAFGCTITARLNLRRIQHAKTLLMESSLNIKEIARDCGFNDPVYFRRLFRRQCDLPPRAFRKLYARVRINTI